MPTITPEVQTALYAEADVRFAAKYGIARKLNPTAPADQKWVPLWIAVYQSVLHEWEQGPVAWMHQHPVVAAAHAQAQAIQASAPPQIAAVHDVAAYDAATQQPPRTLDIGPTTVTPHPSGPPPSAVPIDPYAQAATIAEQQMARAAHAAAEQYARAAQAQAQTANISPPGMTPPIAQAPYTPSHVDAHAQAVADAADRLARNAAAQPQAPRDGYGDPAPSSPSTGRIVLGVGIAGAFLGAVALFNHKADKRARGRARMRR